MIEEVYPDLEIGVPTACMTIQTRKRLSEAIIFLHSFIMLAFAALDVFVPRFDDFFYAHLVAGRGMFLYLVTFPFIFMYYFLYKQYTGQVALLVLFTIYSSFAVGLTCALTNGRVIMEAAILTAVVVISLSLYTFRAAKKRRDSTFPTRIIFGGFVVLLTFIIIQASGHWATNLYLLILYSAFMAGNRSAGKAETNDI